MKAHKAQTWSNLERTCFTLLLVLAAFLALYNLEGYPPFISMDEGQKLQLPKNLVLHGKYAVLTSEGFGPFGGGTGADAVNTGVTLMLPIALAFRVLGVSLGAARLVMAIYFIGTFAVLYLCARSLYGWQVALLASLLFLFAGPPWLNTVYLGRAVYGEVPALAFFFLGSWLWFRSFDEKGPRRLLAASTFFGLASLTKDVFAPMLAAVFLGVYVLDRIRSGDLDFRQVAVPVVISIASVLGWRWVLGDLRGASQTESSLWDAIRLRFLVLSPRLGYESLKFLAEHGVILWVVPALAHTLVAALGDDDSRTTIRQVFLPLFVAIWFSWYVIGSIGWHRYAHAGWAVSSILVAKFLYDLTRSLRVGNREGAVASKRPAILKLHQAPMLLLIGILVLWPAQNALRRIVRGDNHAPKAFAEYIEANVPQDALIASEEWEIDFYSNRPYLHHPGGFGTALIKYLQLGQPLTERYDVAVYNPDYVIDGPYGRGTTLISREFLKSRCRLVVSIGDYALYQVNQ